MTENTVRFTVTGTTYEECLRAAADELNRFSGGHRGLWRDHLDIEAIATSLKGHLYEATVTAWFDASSITA